MADYTTFIPKELFSELTGLQIILAIVIILILIFIGYRIYETSNKKRKPESF
ncbi:MAG: hypothetical protein QMD36_04570 [Candidatus Aenigmarchaeota archaeon]|nr:hypothetical protein [Candidatus Aenigmarchaeota archaeon]